ncbi:MAG: hypothetical protein JST32_02935 [Bacteroidetes bacterium]|nr:hypothetical protein [Bacteroidota bacterium]
MKVIASILLFYFGALMAQPFANMGMVVKSKPSGCHPGMCCKEKQQHKGEKPAREQSSACNRDFCNPFVPCGTSIVYRIQLHSFASPALEVSKNQKPAMNDHITSDYLSDCWRPPELLS